MTLVPVTPPPTLDVPSWLRWTTYLIQQVGFPIAVAAYLLGVMQQQIDKLTTSIAANTLAVQLLAQSVMQLQLLQGGGR